MPEPDLSPQSGTAPDRRVRLRPKDSEKVKDYIYGEEGSDSILAILRKTGGLVWPYTPTVNVATSVDYSSYDPVHSNQEFLAFSRSRAQQITVAGTFTAQNPTEAQYLLAGMHFLRSVTKMDFGINAERPGTPPPILLFSAYGQYMFNDLPVVVTNFSFDLPAEKDYVKVPLDIDRNQGNVGENSIENTNSPFETWVPSEMLLAVTLTVQNSPKRQTNTFNLKDFKSGALLRNNSTKGWF